MKRPRYFISARSLSADILASELILALSELFPKIEAAGLLGEWTGKTRAKRLGDLAETRHLQLHEQAEPTEAGRLWLQQLLTELDRVELQAAVFVGYSYLHHELAAYFKSRNVPVVLYEITPVGAVEGLSSQSIAERVSVALGISPHGSELVQRAGIRYHFIGNPHKDRVDRVVVEPGLLGIDPDKTLISIFPGRNRQGPQEIYTLLEKIGQELARRPGFELAISLTDSSGEDFVPSLTKERSAADSGAQVAGVRMISGMNLELLSLSKLAITGCGAITVECGLFQVPVLAIYPAQAGDKSPQAMINQISGKTLVEEYSSQVPLEDLVDRALKLVTDGPVRDQALAELRAFRHGLQGFAAENAADFIGREIDRWQPSQRESKSDRTA